MILNEIKIAWRSLLKNKFFSLLNVFGLMLGFTGFILSYQYINRETSYDKWNPNYDRIYQVGLTANGGYSDLLPPSFAPLIKERIPEIELAGRKVNYNYGGYPMFGESTVYVKNTALIDSGAAKIFQIQSKTGPLYKTKEQVEATLMKENLAKVLFKESDLKFDEPIPLPYLSKSMGLIENIYGILDDRKKSLIDYDLLMIRETPSELDSGNPFLFNTYIQVKEGSDIHSITKKIDKLYQDEIAKREIMAASSFTHGSIYLDPLANLHLRPKAASATPYLIIWIIGILSLIILVLASANFANMIMAQANQRVKELAVKKILGGSRWSLIRQQLLEVLLVTSIAALLSLILLILTGNVLQKWFNDDLKEYLLTKTSIIQLVVVIVFTTLLSGIYPAIVLSGFKSVNLLKGELTSGSKKSTFRNALLTFQIIIAVIFITGMIVVRQQLNFVQTTDKGFEPAQVINFKGIGLYYDAKLDGTYQNLKVRLQLNPNIESVSSATNIPGEGEIPPKKQFSYSQRKFDLDHIGIDAGYFKTLGISTVTGNSTIAVDKIVKDTSAHYAVINETAAKSLGIAQPLGTKIAGCEVTFEVIAIVKDSKAYGFESLAQPALYSFKDECGPARYQTTLMIKTAPGKVQEAIAAVTEEWKKNPSSESLPLDYTFMDQQYALLNQKQVQLQTAFNSFTLLSVIIAALGLVSMSAYHISVRKKEIGIRKVLGASIKIIFLQLNRPFLRICILGSIMAVPMAYLVFDKWLNHFAYRIQIQWWYFLIAIFIVLSITLLSISLQSIKATKANPMDSLKDE